MLEPWYGSTYISGRTRSVTISFLLKGAGCQAKYYVYCSIFKTTTIRDKVCGISAIQISYSNIASACSWN